MLQADFASSAISIITGNARPSQAPSCLVVTTIPLIDTTGIRRLYKLRSTSSLRRQERKEMNVEVCGAPTVFGSCTMHMWGTQDSCALDPRVDWAPSVPIARHQSPAFGPGPRETQLAAHAGYMHSARHLLHQPPPLPHSSHDQPGWSAPRSDARTGGGWLGKPRCVVPLRVFLCRHISETLRHAASWWAGVHRILPSNRVHGFQCAHAHTHARFHCHRRLTPNQHIMIVVVGVVVTICMESAVITMVQ